MPSSGIAGSYGNFVFSFLKPTCLIYVPESVTYLEGRVIDSCFFDPTIFLREVLSRAGTGDSFSLVGSQGSISILP